MMEKRRSIFGIEDQEKWLGDQKAVGLAILVSPVWKQKELGVSGNG